VGDASSGDGEPPGADASMCTRISPSITNIDSSESGWVCNGVTFPSVIRSSKRRNAPPVSSAVAFQMCSPPP